MKVEKFPEILVDGSSHLIWDSRQSTKTSEVLLLLDRLRDQPAILEELLTRPSVCKVIASDGWKTLLQGKCRDGVEVEYVPSASEHLANLAAEFYGHPSKDLCVIGVTGTNGKSSIADIMGQALCRASHKVFVLGTLGARLFDASYSDSEPKEKIKMGFTTPDSPTFQHLLAQARDEGVTHIVTEVSSHATELARVHAIHFDVAIFSNLSQDHLDFHGSMANYLEAKAKLFNKYLKDSCKKSRLAVIGLPDSVSAGIEDVLDLPSSIGVVRITLESISLSSQTTEQMSFSYLDCQIKTPLIGEFNAWNLSLAFEALRFLGVSPDSIKDSFQKMKGISGRLERCARNIFVDFAHTPDALRSVLITLRAISKPKSRIICVFGCGGDRDKEKRPLMGAIAIKFSDRVVVTNDNPRSEDPVAISQDILTGIQGVNPGEASLHVELDRKKAIEFALAGRKKDDIVLVAGKGHENFQIIGRDVLEFSDQKVVRQYLDAIEDLR